jgi:hypothetical protein
MLTVDIVGVIMPTDVMFCIVDVEFSHVDCHKLLTIRKLETVGKLNKTIYRRNCMA